MKQKLTIEEFRIESELERKSLEKAMDFLEKQSNYIKLGMCESFDIITQNKFKWVENL